MAKPRQQRLKPSAAARKKKSGAAPTTASGAAAEKNGKKGVPAPVATATAADWVSGARLRTLPLAIAPVALGTGAATMAGGADLLLAVLCLIVALCLQIGVNFSNDYSDGVRGTDENRVGPARLTGSGAAAPRRVLAVALAFFALAALAGLAIVLISQLYWLLIVGAAAIAAAWFYTGGRRPYGYAGLGEVFVFAFFGIVATCGTTYVQTGTVNTESWLSGVAAGLIASAVLMVNNIRDIEPDRASGKRTLAVMIGHRASRVIYCVMLLVPFVIGGFFCLFYEGAWLNFAGLFLALPACLITLTAKTPAELILALKLTGLAGLVFALGLAAAFAF